MHLVARAGGSPRIWVSVPSNPISPAATVHAPWASHPTLTSLRDSLQITADCWALLTAPDGSSRKEQYLPKGEREPETAYRKRFDAASPSGIFRSTLRTHAGVLSGLGTGIQQRRSQQISTQWNQSEGAACQGAEAATVGESG